MYFGERFIYVFARIRLGFVLLLLLAPALINAENSLAVCFSSNAKRMFGRLSSRIGSDLMFSALLVALS